MLACGSIKCTLAVYNYGVCAVDKKKLRVNLWSLVEKKWGSECSNNSPKLFESVIWTCLTGYHSLPFRALLDMALVEEGPNMEMEVRKKEDDVYRIQLRLLEIQLHLLEEEERYTHTHTHTHSHIHITHPTLSHRITLSTFTHSSHITPIHSLHSQKVATGGEILRVRRAWSRKETTGAAAQQNVQTETQNGMH